MGKPWLWSVGTQDGDKVYYEITENGRMVVRGTLGADEARQIADALRLKADEIDPA